MTVRRLSKYLNKGHNLGLTTSPVPAPGPNHHLIAPSLGPSHHLDCDGLCKHRCRLWGQRFAIMRMPIKFSWESLLRLQRSLKLFSLALLLRLFHCLWNVLHLLAMVKSLL
ncbi:hypothetical protein LIER_01015 [Lithospermum erythrorhizon]|uniref:Uncharacterized protein n=1 Tax=Lithospermum erythrorhizon TaxID=34254 RepID=A0AAV3NKX1_LITER